MKTPLKESAGFSLIEVLIATFLIGAAVLVIANIPQTIRLISISGSESKVREVAAKKLEDIRLIGYDNLAADGTTNFSDPRLNGLSGATATSTVIVCPVSLCSGGEAVKQVTISISWNEGGDHKNFEVVTLVGKGGIR